MPSTESIRPLKRIAIVVGSWYCVKDSPYLPCMMPCCNRLNKSSLNLRLLSRPLDSCITDWFNKIHGVGPCVKSVGHHQAVSVGF